MDGGSGGVQPVPGAGAAGADGVPGLRFRDLAEAVGDAGAEVPRRTTSSGARPLAWNRTRPRPLVVSWRQVADPARSAPAGTANVFQPAATRRLWASAPPRRGRGPRRTGGALP